MGERTRRCLNVVVALIGIIVAAPLLLIVAFLVKLDSAGPAIYRQERVGLCRRGGSRGRERSRRSRDAGGRVFTIYKFRTMTTDQGRGGEKWATRNDARITRLGGVLRATRIDELPQLFNVLKGDMSLVGPRPPLPKEVAEYEPWQHRRLSVRPGVTCTWQINGRNAIDFEEWMKLDLEYIDNWSLWNDAKIIGKTIPAVIRGNGAS